MNRKNVYNFVRDTANAVVKNPYARQAAKEAGKVAINYGVKKALRKIDGSLRTASKPKRQKRIQTDSSKELQTSKSMIMIKPKLKGKTKGKWRATFTAPIGTTSNVGLQACQTIISSVAHSGVIASTDPGATTTISFIKLRDMNPYLKTTGSAIFPSQTPANTMFGLKSIEYEIEIVNGTNTGAQLDLYFVMPKTNSNTAFETMWDAALATDGLGVNGWRACPPGTVVPSGSLGSGGHATKEYPDENPFRLKTMRANWKLLKKVTVNLGVGVNEQLNMFVKYNKVIKPDDLIAGGAFTYYKGYTIQVIAVQRGVVGWDKTVPALIPTFTSSKIGYVVRTSYNMCGVFSNAGHLSSSYVGAAIPTNTLATAMVHIDEDNEGPIGQIDVA